MNSQIIEAGIAHAEVLATLHGDCFDSAWDRQAIIDILAMPGVCALIISTDHQPQGFALFRLAADETEIISIGVSPKGRREGQAGRLLRAIIDQASRQGAEKIFLEVGEDNVAARGLYEKSSFTLVGRRKGYYNHGAKKTDALIYSLEITAK